MFIFMKTLSLDLRERILASYDAGEGTRQEIADGYDVSLGMVKKLLSQRKRTGDIAHRHGYSGRKPYFTAKRRTWIKDLVQKQPDITLDEIRLTLGLQCTLPAIHYVLQDLNLTLKKNPSRQRARARRRSKSPGRVDEPTKPA
jgi:transposase